MVNAVFIYWKPLCEIRVLKDSLIISLIKNKYFYGLPFKERLEKHHDSRQGGKTNQNLQQRIAEKNKKTQSILNSSKIYNNATQNLFNG